MAKFQVRFVKDNGQTLNGEATLTDSNLDRIIAAEKTNMGAATNQAAAEALCDRFLDEMIGDTKTIERNATPPADIPRSR